MVYDKLHDSSHPNPQKLDELYEKVVQGMKAHESFYILHDYIGLSDDYKYDLYDYLNDDYEEYVNAFNKTEILATSEISELSESSETSETSDSYYTASSGSSESLESMETNDFSGKSLKNVFLYIWYIENRGWRSWRDTVLISKLHDFSHPEANHLDGLYDDLADAYENFEKCNDLRDTMGLCKDIVMEAA